MSGLPRRNFALDVAYYEDTDQIHSIHILNEYGNKEGPGGLPSSVFYYPSGNIRWMDWDSAGKVFRENDLPDYIKFYDKPDAIASLHWRLDASAHRENNLPAIICFDEDGNITQLEFFEFGDPSYTDYRPQCIFVRSDGSMLDENRMPIAIDISPFLKGFVEPPKIEIPLLFKLG